MSWFYLGVRVGLFAALGTCACAEDSSDRAATPPYPPSPIIREIVWAPAATIVRAAHDSDNWPLTWADDNALY